MNSKEALVELVTEAKSLNSNDERLTFLREQIEKDLEILEILKPYLKLKVNHRFNTEEIRLDILLKDMTITYNDFDKIKKWLEN